MGGRDCFVKLLLLLCLALLLVACDPAPCTVDQLVAPQNLEPNYDTVDPSTPVTLTWTYPDTGCAIDRVEMYVWSGPEPETPGMTGSTSGSSLFWGVPLQPGKTYFWRAYAEMETGPGPDVQGPSTVASFFTGPECTDPADMLPVDLVSPENHAILNLTDGITYYWDDPTGCLVDYQFELQISLYEDFHEFWHRALILQSQFPAAPSDPVYSYTDGTRYYWRVKTDPAGPQEGPYSDTYTFLVDTTNGTPQFIPTCEFEYEYEPVDLIFPPDGASTSASTDMLFDWHDQADCEIQGHYELQFSLTEDFSEFHHRVWVDDVTEHTLRVGDDAYDFEDCTTYYWRVKTDPYGPREEPFSAVRSFNVNIGGGVCPAYYMLITPFAPWENFVPAEIITPVPDLPVIPEAPSLIGSENMNCRRGPTSDYKIDDTLFKGIRAMIEGRNEESTWWYILSPNLGIRCWVWGAKVETFGDLTKVPIVEPPELPPEPEKPPETNCGDYKDRKACSMHPECIWTMMLSNQQWVCKAK